MTGIQWTDQVWNPITGCTKVSPGCAHCYAEAIDHRFDHDETGGAKWTGERNITLHPERLEQPLRWKKPRKVFVNSMSDLFHEDVPEYFIDAAYIVMSLTPQHTYQILTKRPERFAMWNSGHIPVERWVKAAKYLCGLTDKIMMDNSGAMINAGYWDSENVWLGVSVENQHWADERIPLLLQTPAAVRFLSVEPMLKLVDLSEWLGEIWNTCVKCKTGKWLQLGRDSELICDNCGNFAGDMQGVDWVIIGGESGPKARPFHLEWAEALIAQCDKANIPVLMKQVGSNAYYKGEPFKTKHRMGGDPDEWPEHLRRREFPNTKVIA